MIGPEQTLPFDLPDVLPPSKYGTAVHRSEKSSQQKLHVCYVDYDGCLYDAEVHWNPKQGIFITTPGRALFEWMPILEALLTPYPDVKIVLSTSWVRVKGFAFARKQLSPALQSRVIGATYHRREMRAHEFEHIPRGMQVWEDVVRRKPTNWLAIDDDDIGWPAWCRDKLVKTNGHLGLSDLIVQETIRKTLTGF